MTVFVTVILPAFKAARTLPFAIRSVSGQTFGDFELLVVDDASSDETSQLLAASCRRDPRVRVITHTENRGRSAARNHAIEEFARRMAGLHRR